jgi:hypothetical protein
VVALSNVSPHEQALVELTQWLARTAQYSVSHPACQRLAERAHASITLALASDAPLVVGVLKDDVLVGGAPAEHPAVRARLGPCLHERGVLVLRLLRGVTQAELTALVEILTLPAHAVFDRGGPLRLVLGAGLARVQVEELAHDVTAEERDAQRRRSKLRGFFKEILLALLAQREIGADSSEQLLELLEHPEIAVALLEEDALGVAEAAAGLALAVAQEEARRGEALGGKLRAVLLGLSPRATMRLLLGFPSLVGELRAALAWAFDGFSERELARLAEPAIRTNAPEPVHALYALSVAVPHDGTRLSALRCLGLTLFDWPSDDALAAEALGWLAKPAAEHDSYWSEREILRDAARRALLSRAISAPPASLNDKEGRPPFDGRSAAADVIAIATHTRSFDRFCQALPAATQAISRHGRSDAAIGVCRGLAAVDAPAWKEAARRTLEAIAGASAARILSDLDAASGTLEGDRLEDVGSTVRLLAPLAPAHLLDRLDASDNRKMRRIVLDALPLAGPALVPLLRPRLRSERWFVVRNAIVLFARVGAAAHELAPVHRHPDDRVRLEVVRSLRSMAADEASTNLVVGYLTDPTEEVRQNARLLLRGDLLGDAAIAELERIALDDACDDELRGRVVEALGRCGRDAAALALFRVLHPHGLIESGASAKVRDLAAASLHHSRAPAAAQYFEQGLLSGVRRVRKACERVSGRTS